MGKQEKETHEHETVLLKKKSNPNTASPSVAKGTLRLYSVSEQENKDNTFKWF